MKIQVEQLKCLRPSCGHTWIQKRDGVKPRVCPRCKSYEWDKAPPKKQNERPQY